MVLVNPPVVTDVSSPLTFFIAQWAAHPGRQLGPKEELLVQTNEQMPRNGTALTGDFCPSICCRVGKPLYVNTGEGEMAHSLWPSVGRDLKAFECGFLTSPFPVKQHCHPCGLQDRG